MGHYLVTEENINIPKLNKHYSSHFRLQTCQELLNKKSFGTLKLYDTKVLLVPLHSRSKNDTFNTFNYFE